MEGFDLVVLDVCPGAESPLTTTAICACDDVFVVVVPTAGGVQDAYRSTEALRRLGLRHQLRYIVNRSRPGTDLSEPMADLGGQVIGDIPDDEAVVTRRERASSRRARRIGSGGDRAPPPRAPRRQRAAFHMARLTIGAMPERRPSPRAVRRTESWFARTGASAAGWSPRCSRPAISTSTALDPARKAAAAAAFARMCHTLERPMQLLDSRAPARRRRESAPVAGPHARPRRRDATRTGRSRFATGSGIRARSSWSSQRTRRRHSTPRARRRAIASLRSASARTASMATHSADVVTDGFDGNTAITWSEYREHAAIRRQRCLAAMRCNDSPAIRSAPDGWRHCSACRPSADIAIHLEPAPLGDALGRLNRRLRDFSAHRMLEVERGALGDVHVDIGLDSATALRERLARNLGRPLHLSVIATARGALHRRGARAQRRACASDSHRR